MSGNNELEYENIAPSAIPLDSVPCVAFDSRKRVKIEMLAVT